MPMLDFGSSTDNNSTNNADRADMHSHIMMNRSQLSPAMLAQHQQQHQQASPSTIPSASPLEASSSSAFDPSNDVMFSQHLQSASGQSLPQQQQQQHQQQQLTQQQQASLLQLSGAPLQGQPDGSFDGGSSMSPFDISAEIKRIQQFHQFGGNGNTSNALLLQGGGAGGFGGTSANRSANSANNDANMLLQSMLDAQKVQNPRFDNPLAPSNNLGIGSGTATTTSMTNPLLQPAFFQDPRFLSSLAAAGNTNLLQFNPAGLQVEVPLPSPHSVFHRDGTRRMRGGVIEPFPEKLHRLLVEVEAAGRSDVISFVANGRAFAIHKPDKFFKEIVPLYFRQSRLSSFKRQLNLYGFELINSGPARGGYFHESFVKDRPELCRQMRRVAIRGSKAGKAAGDKEDDDDGHPHEELDLGTMEQHFAEKPHDEGPL